MSEAPEELRQKLCLALDVDDLVAANRLARDLKPYFGVVKIGLELFTAVGPDAIGTMIDQGYKVFVDLKLHDIPNTVERAARVLGSLGTGYLTKIVPALEAVNVPFLFKDRETAFRVIDGALGQEFGKLLQAKGLTQASPEATLWVFG